MCVWWGFFESKNWKEIISLAHPRARGGGFSFSPLNNCERGSVLGFFYSFRAYIYIYIMVDMSVGISQPTPVL